MSEARISGFQKTKQKIELKNIFMIDLELFWNWNFLDSGEKVENPKSGTSSFSEDSEEIKSVEDANVTLTENNPKEAIPEFKARKKEFQAWFDIF